jgi:uncharacterized protein (TIGR04222 family)
VFPFTLPGAQFLGFYAAFAALLIAALWLYVRSGEPGEIRLAELTADPYRIAHMRGGYEETVRVAIANLVDRGLLAAEGAFVRTARADAADFVRRPLDLAILKRATTAESPASIAEDRAVQTACATYEDELQRKGLLPGAAARARSNNALFVVAGLLAGLFLARMLQAFGKGQGNVFLLLLVAGVALWLALQVWRIRITPKGARALSSLRTLMRRLKDRKAQLVQGGATNESLLLMAVFGVHELPFSFVRRLFPKPKRRRDDSGCGGGSGCGSGGGSGSGCGGGGGCGGCGGS